MDYYLELTKLDNEMKQCLNIMVGLHNRSVLKMLKIRTSNHKLAVEKYRFGNRKEYRKCICKTCDAKKVEDIFHVFVECPCYETMGEN